MIFYDLRFGREDFWLRDQGNFVWGNRVLINDDGEADTFEQIIPSFDARSQNISLFIDRIWGE